MDPRVCLEVFYRRENVAPAGIQTPDSLLHTVVTTPTVLPYIDLWTGKRFFNIGPHCGSFISIQQNINHRVTLLKTAAGGKTELTRAMPCG